MITKLRGIAMVHTDQPAHRPATPLLGLLFATLLSFAPGAVAHRAQAVEPDAESPSGKIAAKAELESHFRQIVATRCVECHGPGTRKAELNLATPEGILKGSESGSVVEPGKPEESLLFEMVREGLMPPDGKKPLSDEEVDVVRRWIEGGARFSSAGHESAPTEHDVVPILLLRCTVCHGLRKQEGGLDLRTKAAMLRGGKSGPALVPGKPDESLLLRRILAEEMPPRRRVVEVSVKPMPANEAEVLRQWIAAGAPAAPEGPEVQGPDAVVSDEDRNFWAFQPPRDVETPCVDHADRVGNAIDSFVLAKLEAKGLSLAPVADRLTLLRRAYLDLTGLPPEPDEVEAFLSDTSPTA